MVVIDEAKIGRNSRHRVPAGGRGGKKLSVKKEGTEAQRTSD